MTKQEIAVESSTAQSLAAEASSRGKTLYAFTNQILDVALRVFGQGGDASEILPAWKSYRVTKDIEGVPFLPRSLVWKMVERLYQRDPEWLLQEWFEAGRRIGEVLRTVHPTLEDLQVGMTGNPSIMTEQRIEIIRQRSAGDGRQQVRVRVVTDLTPELASCGESLLHGLVTFLLHGLDLAVRHAVVRLDLPLHLFLRHADLPRQDDLQLSFEPVLVEVNPHVRDEPVEDETPVDEEVLVGPRGHGAARRCGGLYLIRSFRGSPDAIEQAVEVNDRRPRATDGRPTQYGSIGLPSRAT